MTPSKVPLIALIATLALLVLNGLASYHSLNAVSDSNRWVAHSQQVLSQLEAVLSAMKDAETGQRGYLLTGRQEYLEDYDEGVNTVFANLEELGRLTADNPTQQKRIADLGRLIADKLAELGRTVALRKAGRGEEALKIVLSNDGKRVMDAARGLVARMDHEERELLKAREAQSTASLAFGSASLAVATTLALCMVGLVSVLGRRHTQTVQRAADAADKQRERFRVTLASIGDAVVVTDQAGVVTFLNDAAQALTGWTEADALCKPLEAVFRIISEVDRQTVESPVARAIREGAAVGLANHTILIDREGAERAIADSAAPIKGGDGRVFGVVLVFQDVTERRRAELALQASEERYDLAVRGSNDGIWDWDVRTDRHYFSDRCLKMWGYEPGAAAPAGGSWMDLIDPEDRVRVESALQVHLAEHVPYDVEYRVRIKDGTWRWFKSRGQAVWDENGRPLRMAGSITDVTDRRHNEKRLLRFNEELELQVVERTRELESEAVRRRQSEDEQARLAERLGLLLESTDEGLCGLDPAGCFTFVNRRGAEMLGWRAVELIGRSMHETCHHSRPGGEPYPADECPVTVAFSESKGSRVIGEVYWRKDGGSFPVEYASHPIDDGVALHGVVVTFMDVSARLQAEEALRDAKAAADAANHAKSEFLANMSHEIRTPMNGILGMTDLALDTELTSEQREFISTVKASAESLLDLINDILDFSKIEAGKLDLDPHPFSLRDGLGDLLKPLALRAQNKGLELACRILPDAPDALFGDLGRLRQVVVNLVGNAVKFTEKGEVVVRVGLGKVENGEAELHFAVTDSGVGIQNDKLRSIFEPFTQADASTTRKYGGTGLGLTISGKLVELMGGRVWAESEVDTGSTFHFTARFGVRQEERAADRYADLDGLTVLVADDNASSREILEEMLAGWRMRPAVASDLGAAAKELGRADDAGSPFAVLLLDASLKGGPEALGRLRPDGPAVVLLSSADRADAAPWDCLDPIAALTKPPKPSELFDAILSAVGITKSKAKSPLPVQVATVQAAIPMRVLLAEDNVVNQHVGRRILEKRGHLVTLAANGREAVAAVERQSFDVILMDMQMPEMDGLEATAAIRRAEAGTNRHIHIVALTANALTGDRERCIAAGMDGYLSKPLRREEMWRAMAEAAPKAAVDGEG